jgi:hypothetical protein
MTYESDEVEVFHETVKAELLMLEASTLEMPGVTVGAAVVKKSGAPAFVVDAVTELLPVLVALVQK